jgi:hypothetical protein
MCVSLVNEGTLQVSGVQLVLSIYHCFIHSGVRWIKFCFEIDLKEFMKTQARILILLEILLGAYKSTLMKFLSQYIVLLYFSGDSLPDTRLQP